MTSLWPLKIYMLVVDDKRENRQLLVEWLQATGFVVREAANGQEAIEIWEAWSPHMIWMDVRMPVLDGYEATQKAAPDLILLDVQMPGLDGYAVCRQLKADEQTHAIPVIFISSAKSPTGRRCCVMAAARGWPSKFVRTHRGYAQRWMGC